MTEAIGEQHLAPGSVYPGALQQGAFTTTHVMTGAITSALIADGTVAGEDIAPSAITSGNVLRGGGLYSSKSEIYTKESEVMEGDPGVPLWPQVSCEDGDDLPLHGFCRTLTGSAALVGTNPVYWDREGVPAIFQCAMEPSAQGAAVVAAIACIRVGDNSQPQP